MKNDIVHLLVGLLIVVFCAAFEELLPNFSGVGFPLLMMASIVVSARRMTFEMVLIAILSGTFEDTLSSLPFATSIGYFLVSSALMHWSYIPKSAALAIYPIYQLWVAAWTGIRGGEIFLRMVLALPLGAMALVMVTFAISWLDRKASIDG